MTVSSIATWTLLSRRFDALLSSHKIYQRLPSASVNGAQATALLSVGQEMGREMLALRAMVLKENHGYRFGGAYFARLETLVESSMATSTNDMRAAHAAELILSLSFLRNDLSMFFHDGQEMLKLRAERAFRHLQWSIASTPSVQATWREAFERHETACEALGATHLLLHGIFAYKANTPDARTDLVFHEPVDAAKASTVAEGLVLTEWKRVRKTESLEKVIADAEEQAQIYSTGVLEGTELRRVRYVVVVTESQVRMPEDKRRDDYVVRHVNIAVDPLPPSKAASKLST
jgi:hypothetical protein